MTNENPQPEFLGMSKTAYDEIVARQPDSSQCYDWALENIEQVDGFDEDSEFGVFEVQLSWKQKSAVEAKGFILRTEKALVKKFMDDRENIIVTS